MAIVKMNAGAGQKVNVELTKGQLWLIRKCNRVFTEMLWDYKYIRDHYSGDECHFPVSLLTRDRLFDESVYWDDELEECDFLFDLLYSVYDKLCEIDDEIDIDSVFDVE